MLRLILGTPRRHTNCAPTVKQGTSTTQQGGRQSNIDNRTYQQDATENNGEDEDSNDVSSSASDLNVGQEMEEAQQEDCLEPWQDWIKRATRECEQRVEKLSIESWLVKWRRQQWRFAQKLVTHDIHKWSYAALKWQPDIHNPGRAARQGGHPYKRWDEDIKRFLSQSLVHKDMDWINVAAVPDTWKSLENSFCEFTQ
eukprot:8871716-Karenia_brevis.AAC.1